MPITYFNFCALATLLFYIPDKPFLKTTRFELALLWDKLSQTSFKKDLNNPTPVNAQITGLTTLKTPLTTFRTPIMGFRSTLMGLDNGVNGVRNVVNALT